MLAKMNLDELSHPAREFYERARMKMSLSLILISIALFFLGLCSQAGGKSLANNTLKGAADDDHVLRDLSAGYGFACFMYIIGFFISLASAVYISPLAGTRLEMTMLKSPQEIDSISGNVDPNGATVNPAYARAEPLYSGYADPQSNVSKI